MNGYSRDLLQERVAVAKRYDEQSQTFGGSSTVTKYEWLNKAESDHGFWCKHDWTRGLKAMHEGALDAYDIVTFRMDFDPAIDRWCLLLYEGKWYQIQNLNGSQRENKLQIQAIEMANQNVTIVEPTPEPASNSGTTDETEPATEATGTTDETEPATEATGTGTNEPVNPEPQNEG